MMEAMQVKQTLSPHMMWDLYQKLANDDEFRCRLEQNPAEVLGAYGIPAPESAAGTFTLPDKEVLADSLKRVSLGSAFVANGVMGWDAWAAWVFVFLAPANQDKIEVAAPNPTVSA